MSELADKARQIILRKLGQSATRSAVEAVNPFSAAQEAAQGLGELADKIDEPRKYFIDKSAEQMDFNKSITGQSTPGIEQFKQAVDMVVPSAYDLLPGAKTTKMGVKAKSTAELLRDTPGTMRTIVKDFVQNPGKVVVKASKPVEGSVEVKRLGETFADTVKRMQQKNALDQIAKKIPVKTVEGPTVQSTSVLLPK